MTTYLVINRLEDLNIENFKVGLPRGQKYSIIRYTDPKDKSRKQLYLQTPGVHLGNMAISPKHVDITTKTDEKPSGDLHEETKTDESNSVGAEGPQVESQQDNLKKENTGYAYLDLYLHREKDEFRKMLNEIDVHIIKRIWTNRVEWGLSKDTSLIEIERCWIPSLKISSLNYDQTCLKFALPMKSYNGNPYLDMDVYDQENYELPISLLKPEYPARGLLFYKGVIKDGNYFSLDWELKQLKVKIPDQVFDDCQLSDEEEAPNNTWVDSDEELEPIYE